MKPIKPSVWLAFLFCFVSCQDSPLEKRPAEQIINEGGPFTESEIAAIQHWLDDNPDRDIPLIKTNQEKLNHLIREKILQIHPKSGFVDYTHTIPAINVDYEMVAIPGGRFMMGSSTAETGEVRSDEFPRHEVEISPFWLGKYEVTWDQFDKFSNSGMGRNKDGTLVTSQIETELHDWVSSPTTPYMEMDFGMGKNGFPAINMTQNAANHFCQWLSAQTGHYYRLPTEAEWEYACRAGTTTAFSCPADELDQYAVFDPEQVRVGYEKIGTKKPNPWGLFDIHGNVFEWCLDGYDPVGYANHAGVDPYIPATTRYPRIARGGSWYDPPGELSSARRIFSDPDWKSQDAQLPKSIWWLTDALWLGFRIARPLKVPDEKTMLARWKTGMIGEEKNTPKPPAPHKLLTFREPHMGTLYTVRSWTQQGKVDDLTLFSQKAFQRIHELEQIFSDYIKESELNRLARAPANEEIVVSEELFDIFQKAEKLFHQTDGAFDITVGPMIRQWRLARKNHRLPSPEQIADAKARSGFHLLTLNPKKRSITKARENMIFDLGGIAKGYAADEALKILREGGFSSSLVAASGDIAVGDPPPGKKGWTIGIETLLLDADPKKMQTVTLSNAAISTSGDTRQFVEIDGVRYSHIVDPKTGLGLSERIGASVIAPNATTTDSHATAVSILGEKEGLKFIENTRGVECQIVKLQEGDETFLRSNGFPAKNTKIEKEKTVPAP